MGCCATFFAIFKAYTTLNIFSLPIGFKCGGWLFSPIVLIVACFFELTCAVKLTTAANKVQIYSYPDLVEYALGKTYLAFFSVVQAVLNLAFTFAPLAFFMKTLFSFFTVVTGQEQNMVVYLVVTILVFAPLLWVRTVETFQVGYIFAVILIATLLIVASALIFQGLADQQWEAGEGWTAFNSEQFIIMWGLSFYMYEGVGCVMPVMEASEYKENFTVLLVAALVTLCATHVGFSELCYYYWGATLKEPIVTEQLPQGNWFLILAKLLFCVNILFSIPLIVYITNQIVEGFVFQKMRFSHVRTWLKNLSRTVILTCSALVSYFFYYQLHKVFSLIGVLLGSFIVIVTPALVHYKLVSDTKCSKVVNVLIIIYAIVAALALGSLLLYTWSRPMPGH